MSSPKRRKVGLSGSIQNLCWQRQLGQLNPPSFTHRVAASEDLVRRLTIDRNLEKHRGCVNTVSFNADGNILVSGSDDRMVILWDWDAATVKLAFHSGHHNNVFQAKIMPFTNDQSFVTCAADGQVRHARIDEGGRVETTELGNHDGRAHKLAIEPGSSHVFYTCGEDAVVQHFDLRTRSATKLFKCHSRSKSNYKPIVHLNAISIDPRNPYLFSVGGSDQYARLYDIRKFKWNGSSKEDHPVDCFCPSHLMEDTEAAISGLSFSEQSELLVSYNAEQIYLFSKHMGLGHDPVVGSDEVDANKPKPQAYKGHRNCDTVKGVNFFGPNSEYVVSGSDCGRIFIWRKNDAEVLRAMEGDKDVVNCIVPHPHATILASSGIEDDVKIWTPKASRPSTLPVDVDELKYKNKRWLPNFPSREDMILQILLRDLRSFDGTEDLSEDRATFIEYLANHRNNADFDEEDESASDNNAGVSIDH